MMERGEFRFMQLAEEASEVQKCVFKLLRFGLNDVEPGQPLTNIERLRLEVGDFFASLKDLEDHGNLNPWDEGALAAHIAAKQAKVERWARYSEARSRLAPEPCHECGGDRISRQSKAAFEAKQPCPSCVTTPTAADDRSPCCGRRGGLHHDMCPKQPL